MKVPTFLMAMVLLVGAAPHRSPLFNLHVILSEVEKLNQSHPQDYFVEDLRELAEGENKCGGAFFCRVHNVLVHNNFSKLLEEENLGQKKKPKGTAGEVIVRNLEAYINARKVNCSRVLNGVKTSNISTDVAQFWEKVASCCRTCNLHGCK